MAFVTRGARETGFVQQTTTPGVGPGAYLNLKQYATEHAYAPFASTMERPSAFDTASTVPGPGTYSKLTFTVKKEASTLAFTSRQSRLAKETHADGPGPGTYNAQSDWVKNALKRVNDVPTARRITFQRMPTAPSVPQRHQSYGYEEGEAGELIMQFPADRGHTGRPGDTVGPAKYTPSIDAASAKGPKAVSWSKSRSQRTSGMGVGQALDGPGPGAYQPPGALADSVPDASLQAYDPLNPNLPSSSFASRVPLKHQQLVDEDSITPGPGSYAPVDQFRKRRVPEAHQFFGSTALRPYQVEGARLRSAIMAHKTPGPGAYTEHRILAKAKDGPEAPPFHSTASRFELTKEHLERPGPGTYDENNELNFVEEVGKRLASRSAVFGTTGPRFRGETKNPFAAEEAAPGPQSYNAGEVTAMGNTSKGGSKPGSTGGFGASTAPRFQRTTPPPTDSARHRPKLASQTQVPAPGTYTLPDGWIKNNLGAHKAEHMVSQAERFPANQAMPGLKYTLSPGPGAYTPKFQKKPVHNANCFGTNSSRFVPPGSLAPGPGTYDAAGVDHGLIKRSFNVTIDGVEF